MKSFADGLVSAVLLLLALIATVFVLWPVIATIVTVGLVTLAVILISRHYEKKGKRNE